MLIRDKLLRVFSSVGLERYLDRVEVMGSNPLTPTRLPKRLGSFSLIQSELLANFWSKSKFICIGNAIAFVDIL